MGVFLDRAKSGNITNWEREKKEIEQQKKLQQEKENAKIADYMTNMINNSKPSNNFLLYKPQTTEQNVKTETAGKNEQIDKGPTYRGIQEQIQFRNIKKDIGFDTLQSDLTSLYTNIGNAYNGWQSRETMDNTFKSVKNMYERIGKVQEYSKKYGGIDLSELYGNLKTIMTEWDELSREYARYKNADSYKQSVQNSKDKLAEEERMKTDNLDVVRKDLANLEGIYNNAKVYNDKISKDSLSLRSQSDVERFQKDYNKTVNERDGYVKSAGFESYDALEKAYGEKKRYLNRAEWLQKGIELSSIINEKDFIEKSNYVALEEKGAGIYRIDEDEERYKYINDKEYRDIYADNVKSSGDAALLGVGYEYMTDEEKKIYNYYYNSGEKEKANEYLHTIVESLGERKSVADYEYFKGKTFKEMLYGVNAGIDQFMSGMKNVINFKDEYIPVNSVQQLSGLIRDDLNYEHGKKGTIPYDLITTTSNMLPSILTSTLIGKVNPVLGANVGSTLMGASAAGNAYQEMLNLGYDKGQARTYSSIVGVAEASLQKIGGGISKLGGVSGKLSKIISSIDNAAARFAINYGGSMVAEGLEEATQEILNPIIKNFAAGYDTGADVDWGEVLYSGLLGAMSGGFMEGGPQILNARAEVNIGKNIKSKQKVQNLFDIANNPEISEAYETLQRWGNKGITSKNVTDAQLGRLYNEVKNNSLEKINSKDSTDEQKANARNTLLKLSALTKNMNTNEGGTDGLNIVSHTDEIFKNKKEPDFISTAVTKALSGLELTESDINILVNNPDVFSKYAKMELPQNPEERKAFISQYADSKKADMQEFNYMVDSLSKKTGTTIEYDATLEAVETLRDGSKKTVIYDGYYDPENNKIVVNPNSPNALKYIIFHELTHFAENKKGFEEYADILKESAFFKDYIIENYGTEEAFYDNVYERYKGVYKELNTENLNKALKSEMLAEINGVFINMDEAALRKIAKNDSKMQKIFKAIIDFFKELYYSVNGETDKAFALKMQNKFEKLLTAEKVGNANSEVRYSIIHSDKMGDIAFLDKELIKKNDNESYNQAIKNFFNDNFKNHEIEILENKETVNLDQIGKYLHPGSKVENYREKQVASQILDDIIRIAKNKTHSEDLMVEGKKKEHSGLNADNGWDYYDTQFAIDESGIIYGGVIIVRKSKNGKNYFYDIDKIREVGYQDVKEFNPVKYGRTSLKDNISQPGTIVNNNSMQNSEKNTKTKQFSISNNENTLTGEVRLPYNEYIQLREYVMLKNNSSKSIRKLGCKEIGNNFYIWINKSKTDFKVFSKIKIEGNEQLIKTIRSEMKNGTITNSEGFTSWIESVSNRRRNDNSNNVDVEESGTNGRNDNIHDEKRNSNAGYDSKQSTEDSRNIKRRYSITGTEIKENNSIEEYDERYERLVKQYRSIPTGENPYRDIEVPKRSSESKYVSRFARTLAEAEVMPEGQMDDFKRLIVEGKMSHEIISDKSAEKKAIDKMKNDGFWETFEQWQDNLGKRYDKNYIVQGQALFNQAATAGDVETSMKLAADLAMLATETGQNLQAVRMLKKMSPDGQLYCLERTVQRINNKLEENAAYKDKTNIKINPELAKKLLKSNSSEEMQNAVEEIQLDIAKQVPSTLEDKINAWRYLSMLGNPKTHIRNILGNAMFRPVIGIKDMLGAVIEKYVVTPEERTKSVFKSKNNIEFAKDDYKKLANELKGKNKYDMGKGIMENRAIFKNKLLETIRTKNNILLEAEDDFFFKSAYINAFSQAMTARKLTPLQLSLHSEEAQRQLESLRHYAANQAQTATFRDASSTVIAINKFRNDLKKTKAGRIAGIGLDAVIPFTKTPVNIVKRGIDYSPIGLVKGIMDTFTKVKKGKITATDAVEEISRGLTGSAIVALGWFLAKMGWLTGNDDEDKKKSAFDDMTGYQSYALNMGDVYYTVDWITPFSLPLFVGCEIYNITQEKGLDAVNGINAITRLADPIINLSMLSGINNTVKSSSYNGENAISGLGMTILSSYASQFIPTAFSQIAKTFDNNTRSIYHDKNSNIPEFLDETVQTLLKKIPGASALLQPKIDNFGREQKGEDNFLLRTFENFISPGYFSRRTVGEVENIINEIYNETGDNSVFPPSASKSITVSGVKKQLDADTYTKYAAKKGSIAYSILKDVVKLPKFKKLSTEEKVEIIEKVYRYANDVAKYEVMNIELKGNTKKIYNSGNAAYKLIHN